MFHIYNMRHLFNVNICPVLHNTANRDLTCRGYSGALDGALKGGENKSPCVFGFGIRSLCFFTSIKIKK